MKSLIALAEELQHRRYLVRMSVASNGEATLIVRHPGFDLKTKLEDKPQADTKFVLVK